MVVTRIALFALAFTLLPVSGLSADTAKPQPKREVQPKPGKPAEQPAQPAEQAAQQAAYEPTSHYAVREVRGFSVYVHQLLEADEHREVGRRGLELLDVKLYDVVRVVPEPVLVKLRQIPIWIEWADPRHRCACYHPSKSWLLENGFNPEKAGAVEIANVATFLDWTHEQPFMVLHELAHGYHHRFLGGYKNPEIAAAYQKAVAEKRYESVLHYDGKRVRAYALNNPQEYFAELSEAWFGANDFFPFVRAEVVRDDPEGARLMRELWGQ